MVNNNTPNDGLGVTQAHGAYQAVLQRAPTVVPRPMRHTRSMRPTVPVLRLRGPTDALRKLPAHFVPVPLLS